MHIAQRIRMMMERMVTRGRVMLREDMSRRMYMAPQAQEEPAWCHINLMAMDGTRIDVDYQIRGSYSRSGWYIADPIWINVKNQSLGPSSRVRVVLMEVGRHAGATKVQEIDLRYQEPGRFSGPAAMSTTLNNYHELAVVIDDRWLRDPISKMSNFQFNMGLGFETCRKPQ